MEQATQIPAESDLVAERSVIEERAAALTITSQEEYESAAVFVRDVKALLKRVSETFDPIQKKAHAAWQEVLKKRKEHEEPLKSAEKVVKGRLSDYATEQARIAREEQARLEREAREAEAKRLAAERKAEEEARLAEAEALEDAGMADEAIEVLSEPLPDPDPMPMPTPPVRVAKPTAAGVSMRETWQAEVTDIRALVAAVAAGTAPITLLRDDATALRQFAVSTKGSVTVPGVRFYSQTSVSAKAS